MTTRHDPPLWADEWDQLNGYLDYLRGTIALKCEGLTDAQMHSRLAPSSMTLGGLLVHLSFVEDYWFGEIWNGRAAAAPWSDVDWRATPDIDWEIGAEIPGAQARARWHAAVTHARTEATRTDLDGLAVRPIADGEVSRRWILLHMIEEYARHCGHADLLREAIDGSTGE